MKLPDRYGLTIQEHVLWVWIAVVIGLLGLGLFNGSGWLWAALVVYLVGLGKGLWWLAGRAK